MLAMASCLASFSREDVERIIEKAVFDIAPPRVTVKEMVDAKFLHIGEEFIHKNGRVGILYNDKGHLQYNNIIDSMHVIAAKMMNRSLRVNAFDYFYVKRNGNLVSVADIRNEYRKQIYGYINKY